MYGVKITNAHAIGQSQASPTAALAPTGNQRRRADAWVFPDVKLFVRYGEQRCQQNTHPAHYAAGYEKFNHVGEIPQLRPALQRWPDWVLICINVIRLGNELGYDACSLHQRA